MSINGINPAYGSVTQNISTKNPIKEVNNYSQNTIADKNQDDTKSDNKKKIMLTLGALAVAGAVIAGTVYAVKHGKAKPISAVNEAAQDAQHTGEKIKNLIKIEDIPFDEALSEERIAKNGLKAYKNTNAKYIAQYNGKNVIVEEKSIVSSNLQGKFCDFAFIRDIETDKILEIKKIDICGNEITSGAKKYNNFVVKTAKKFKDEAGNKVLETYKDGKLHSTQTTILNQDGSRRIIITYADQGSKDYKKIIDIAKDGTKKVTEEGRRLFSI